jgi:hypothetical protein
MYQRISLSSVRTDRVADIVDQKIATAESMIPSKPDIDDDDDDDLMMLVVMMMVVMINAVIIMAILVMVILKKVVSR